MTDAAGEPTLRALLTRRDLGLVLVVAGDLDVDIRGVHSSDLADPTPFLSEGLALLTTGTQFGADDSPAAYDGYVARLVRRGVAALGFGTEVVRDGVPDPLVEAARRHRMPLVEVPYRTPFIAVARANAEAIAARAYARRSWALAAQRAISLAALRPDGLRASVAELSRQVGAWVGLFDRAGAMAHESGAAPADRGAIDAGVAGLLGRRQPAAATLDSATGQALLQTLGRGGHLRGVLVVAGPRLDAEARSVVTAVAALAALVLEQSSAALHARATLGAEALACLLDGDVGTAERIARPVGGLPAAPVQVGVLERPPDAVAEWLEGRGDAVLFTVTADELVLLTAAPAEPGAAPPVAEQLVAEFGVALGISAPVGLDRVAAALQQARTAVRGAPAGIARFEASALLSASTPDDARVHARAVVAPLAQHDAAHGTDLVATLRAWLEEDGAGERTAERLGVHRHTVRARIALAERVLGQSLAAFPVRAELWLALRLSG